MQAELGAISVASAVKVFFFACLTCTLLFAQSDPRIPPEVRFKSAYVNPVAKPSTFASAMLWGIAIADNRVPRFQNAKVEIANTRLICRANGSDFVLNADHGAVRGGLYRRHPWFGTDMHEPMPIGFSSDHRAVILRVGTRPDKVWHFWAASARALLPAGHLDGCTVTMRVRISAGALLQAGFDYWRDTTVGYGAGGNNHEAGASEWHFSSPAWQEITFSDLPQ